MQVKKKKKKFRFSVLIDKVTCIQKKEIIKVKNNRKFESVPINFNER